MAPGKKFRSIYGQASTEYLLIVATVLLTLVGVAALFSKQISGYLSTLFSVLSLPF